MSEFEKSWPVDAVDAISILAFDGEFKIEGTDGDQIELDAEFESQFGPNLQPEPTDRWLQFQMWNRAGEGELTLRLPKRKTWVVEVSAARGEVEVKEIRARLRVMIGRGEIEIQDCEGVFNLASGKGEIKVERCREAEMPERPPRPAVESPFGSGAPFEMPPMPHGKSPSGEFRFSFGDRARERHRHGGPRNWDFDWDWDWDKMPEEWAQWGTRLGEQARVWAEQFARQFADQPGWLAERSGIALHIGRGEAQLEGIEAKSCAAKLASGEVHLEHGRIEKLELRVSHGNIECESVLPAGEWELQTRHGDIHLTLPADTQARLDVATRHGDIESDIPLVRVGRPGREARHGGRMVGTVGPTDGGAAAQINVTATAGDVQIELEREKSRYSGAGPAAVATAATPEAAAVSTPASTEGAAASAVPTERGAATTQADPGPAAPAYDSQLAILQALSEKKITVQEAEKLLKALDASKSGQRPLWEFLKGLSGKSSGA